jgi:predicted enzyme related to lactoylglutathione lyase
MSSRNPVGWFEIYVQDMNRARAFYENTLRVTLQKLESPIIEMFAFPSQPDQPGCGGSLVKMEGKDSGGGTIVYFSCADCADEEGRAAANGGEVIKNKFSIGQYGFISLVRDTEGNIIGFHSLH